MKMRLDGIVAVIAANTEIDRRFAMTFLCFGHTQSVRPLREVAFRRAIADNLIDAIAIASISAKAPRGPRMCSFLGISTDLNLTNG